jgi:hypothetical protein
VDGVAVWDEEGGGCSDEEGEWSDGEGVCSGGEEVSGGEVLWPGSMTVWPVGAGAESVEEALTPGGSGSWCGWKGD